MVLGVCRRILDDPHAAEDAFQATFLVLVKKARTLRDRSGLPSWLYGVAQRTARKARASESRRRAVEYRVTRTKDAIDESSIRQAELRTVIDEEIRRLPEHYRVPLVLCHMEGLQHEEVAQRLGCPVGTVESRLYRARERLRARLLRRGLAPTAGVMLAVLRPIDAPGALVPLIDTTLKAALAQAVRLAGGARPTVLGIAGRILALRSAATARAGLTLLALFAGSTILILGMDVYRANGTPPLSLLKSELAERKAPDSGPEPPAPDETPPATRRSPAALVRMMSPITVDGRLGDWPTDMKRHPIRDRLTNDPNYDPETWPGSPDGSGYFMAGYNRDDGRIYVAVVVSDEHLLVKNGNPLSTDAVELYVEALGRDWTLPEPDPVVWGKNHSAKLTPAMQYVGLAGPGRVYGEPETDGTALMYGRIEDTQTEMGFRRSGNVIVYEWAVQVFDRFPDRPSRLEPGKHIGFDVAIVDRDGDRRRPFFTTWAPAQTRFKGFDAAQLGELVLGGGP
jgi:RNA polymerase sigma factor (sigma-70 family)